MKTIFLNIFILFILKSNAEPKCADEEKSPFEKILSQRSFIDKTDLIKHIMENYKGCNRRMIFTMPRQFGKTTNMDMMKRFLERSHDEVQNTSNFLLFNSRPHNRPLNIMNDQNFVKKHFGQYPIIHIDLSIAGSNGSLDTLFTKVIRKFVEAIRKYEWLYIKKYRNADLNRVDVLMKKCFEFFLFNEASNISIDNKYDMNWLFHLGRSLYEYYGVPPILLVDEYDCPILEALLHQINPQPVIQRLMALWWNTLKPADSPFLFTFMVGITGITPDIGFSSLTFTTMSFLSDYNLGKFYGFYKDEMNLLFHRYNINNEDVKSHITRFYNGYRRLGGEEFYNPGSICSFLTRVDKLTNVNDVKEVAKLLLHHPVPYLMDLLQSNLENPHIYDIYVDLTIHNKSECFLNPYYEFSCGDMETLGQLFKPLTLKSKRKPTPGDTLYFFFLWRTGFLSCDGSRVYVIPNEEARYHLKRSFSNHYCEKNYKSCCFAKTVIDDFKTIANNTEVTVEEVNKTKNSLQLLFKYIMEKKELNPGLKSKEDDFQTSLYVALHQSGNFHYINMENTWKNKDKVEDEGKNEDTFGEADIVIVTEDCNTLLIVEFEYNVTPLAFDDLIKKQLRRHVPTVPFRNMIQGFDVTLKYLLVNVIVKSEKGRGSEIKESYKVEIAYCPAGNYSKEDISTSPLAIKFDKSCMVLRKNKPRIKSKLN